MVYRWVFMWKSIELYVVPIFWHWFLVSLFIIKRLCWGVQKHAKHKYRPHKTNKSMGINGLPLLCCKERKIKGLTEGISLYFLT